ncbi:dephospho-CoA kinase [Thiolapillus sp.]
MPVKIGLTGGIASGKSTVADQFAALGAEVIDADRISRELVAPGSPLLREIADRLGEQFIREDGSLDRTGLREQVFRHPEARRTLEGILHPAIRREMLSRAEHSASPYVVLVIPLLVETGQHDLVDRILVVDVPEETQLQRLCARDHTTMEQARQILGAQVSRQERLAVADDIVHNAGAIEELEPVVARLHRDYLALAGDGSH